MNASIKKKARARKLRRVVLQAYIAAHGKLPPPPTRWPKGKASLGVCHR